MDSDYDIAIDCWVKKELPSFWSILFHLIYFHFALAAVSSYFYELFLWHSSKWEKIQLKYCSDTVSSDFEEESCLPW